MKKTLNFIVGIIVVVVLAFVLAGIAGPKAVKMERTTEIKAAKPAIFKVLADYSNFHYWSPWQAMDSAMKTELFGTQGQPGAGYKWSGNDKVGAGEMKIAEMSGNDSISVDLTFIRPFKSAPHSYFKLQDSGNGNTRVSWGFEMEVPFMFRPMMLFMNMEKEVAPDYEHGLANLKTFCEKNLNNMEVKMTEWPGHTYMGYRSNVEMKDLGKVFQEKMPRAFQKLGMDADNMAGPPSGLYFSWDTASGKTDMAVAIPVKQTSKGAEDFLPINVPASKAIEVDYYGPYEQIKTAYDALHAYMVSKQLKYKGPAIEEYVGDPGLEKDPAKVLTKVYFLVED